MTEEWCAFPELEGLYEISSSGQVRRVVGGQGARAGRLIKLVVAPEGRRSVILRVNKKSRHFNVDRLVNQLFN